VSVPRRCRGFREEEWDGVGIGESQGNRHLTPTIESSLRRRGGTTALGIPEVSDDHQGALIRLKGQGLQHTLACRRVVSATAIAVVTQRGSCDVRRPRGSNGRSGNRPGN